MLKITPLRLVIAAPVLLVAFSFLGGSAVWAMLGLGGDLTINGNADIVRTDIGDFGDGWGNYGGDSGGNRYSSAATITPENVKQLSVAWAYETGALTGRDSVVSRTTFQATPILVEESLVLCTPFNEIIALDPGTGAEKWRYDPALSPDMRPANSFTCRGVSYWQDQSDNQSVCSSRILSGTSDARIIALDAKTGAPCADFGINGEVKIEPSLTLRWPGEFQITSAPAIIGDTLVAGSSISDNLRREAPSGVVHALDVRTGEIKWTFDPVPRDPADPAVATWQDNSAATVGHANAWSTISVDEDRGLVFLPTSSASPDFFGGLRPGDNRYANSVVALNADDGSVHWNFQTVHHDVWDYDVPAQPGVYQVWRDGKPHDVIAQVTKTGMVFVLDRDTGQPFLPVEERPVPQSGAPGEALSPTQPFPVNTPPLVPNELSAKDAFGITFWDKMECANKIRSLRNEGLFTPPSTQGTLIYPFTGGGANWGGSAYDPARNLLVVNMSNLAHIIRLTEGDAANGADELDHDSEFAPMEGTPYGMTRAPFLSSLGLPCTKPPWGILAGVDLDSGQIVWRKTLGTTRDMAPMGAAMKFGTPNLGGPIVTTSGLVFIGATMDDYLRAFDVETGKELWKGRLPAGGQATPMTYEWKSKQYVVISAGGHSSLGTRFGDHVIAFALPE